MGGGALCVYQDVKLRIGPLFLKMGDGKRRIDRVEAAEHSEMLGFKKVRVKGEEAFLCSQFV